MTDIHARTVKLGHDIETVTTDDGDKSWLGCSECNGSTFRIYTSHKTGEIYATVTHITPGCTGQAKITISRYDNSRD